MRTFQLGTDIGRVIAASKYDVSPESVREAAKKIVSVLELDMKIDEDPDFLLGLGFGLADRHKTPVESGILGPEIDKWESDFSKKMGKSE